MEPRAVIFDLDYTLVVPTRPRQRLLDEATDVADVPRIDRREYLDAHGADLASETRVPIFEALLDQGDPVSVADAYRDAVESALEPVPGIEALLADLGERYRLGLLTDGPTRAQDGKLDRLGWRDRFDAVVVTGALAAGKPDRGAFATVLDALEVTPEEAVYVGDHPVADVEGAAAVGMRTIQVLTDRFDVSPAADATVESDRVADDLRALLLREARV